MSLAKSSKYAVMNVECVICYPRDFDIVLLLRRGLQHYDEQLGVVMWGENSNASDALLKHLCTDQTLQIWYQLTIIKLK